MAAKALNYSLWSYRILFNSIANSIWKLSPLQQIRNPIMFTAYIGAIVCTFLLVDGLFTTPDDDPYFIAAISLSLWTTLLFANFAESIAEERGRSQAQSLRKAKNETMAKKLSKANRNAEITIVPSSSLRTNDIVLVEANDFIPSDGHVIEGIASINESAVTGESAPVIRESGGDNNSVTGGTQVISDWLIIRITSDPGETFLDHMIHLVESAKRQKTPNELALTIFLTSLTLVFLLVGVTLLPFSIYTANSNDNGTVVSITAIVALFVCLAPTTIGGLLSAIGIAGMDRMLQANIIVLSPNIVETAGDIDTLILDKTGTITLGNRHATELIPAANVDIQVLAEAAHMASLADETPEGRSIVSLAREKYGLQETDMSKLGATFIPFTAQTRMSGANLSGRQIRKGSALAIEAYVKQQGGIFPDSIQKSVDSISRKGGTALVVVEAKKILGVIHLKDIIKPGIRARFAKLRNMGIKTIMVTGDNQLTTAAIAAEAGVDDFLAEAYPEDKLRLIRKLQAEGRLVAMTGDGANDSPALAQADVALAMNSGTQAAKEAGNLVDLDSNPTKLIEVIEIGKQLLITRGALTTFSLANDLSKNLAILPAAFASAYPALSVFDVMHLATPHSAILSTTIFNALLIAVLIPLALHGIKYRGRTAAHLLTRNMLIYGLGGLIVPFVGIKLIDMLLIMLDLT